MKIKVLFAAITVPILTLGIIGCGATSTSHSPRVASTTADDADSGSSTGEVGLAASCTSPRGERGEMRSPAQGWETIYSVCFVSPITYFVNKTDKYLLITPVSGNPRPQAYAPASSDPDIQIARAVSPALSPPRGSTRILPGGYASATGGAVKFQVEYLPTGGGILAQGLMKAFRDKMNPIAGWTEDVTSCAKGAMGLWNQFGSSSTNPATLGEIGSHLIDLLDCDALFIRSEGKAGRATAGLAARTARQLVATGLNNAMKNAVKFFIAHPSLFLR
ncbi:hypothetical protein [Nocardia sp. NPDC050710]|uniref:hypothetical protein n=1 Tax=Nocardia sp. NPDC050710 TaxID=3157220 RepID=UPI0033D707CF